MANSKVTPAPAADSVTHTRDYVDFQDVVETKTRQLKALLAMTYGPQSIRVMSNELQDAFMWACADMADDIVQALDGMLDLRVASNV